MGFYGNVANINKTNMTFDKIYSNRKIMDENCANDGVYSGRYVLVEYQQFYPKDTYEIIYNIGKNNDGTYKFSSSYASEINVNIQENKIYRCVNLITLLSENSVGSGKDLLMQYYSNTFYKGVIESGDLKLKEVTNESDETYFIENYKIDKEEYETGKGYDSTVWMKTYTNDGVPKYVNIAELNSVIPTFGIRVDAPTAKPKAPHFGENSSNIYYDLHLQPSWGFQFGNAYYNQDAFKPQVGVQGHNIAKKDNEKTDAITLTPIASGTVYADSKNGEEGEDVYELNISLPSIGNMMSDAWDIIYGPNRDKSQLEYDSEGNRIDSLQGRLDSIAACAGKTIPFKREKSGEIVGAELKGDKWINAVINDSDTSSISITHESQFNGDTQTTLSQDQSPSFGSSVNIPYLEVDKAGHITKIGTKNITLPKGSYEANSVVTESKEILVGLSFDATTGKFTSTKTNSNNFQLDSYDNSTTTDTEIKTGVSINKAFAILENTKVDKDDGKNLSSNDFTDVLLAKLNGIAEGAEVNAQSDWNVTDESSDAFIKNKPDLGELAYKNTLTADDVGALPKDTSIPSIEGLIEKTVFDEKIEELTQIISQLQDRIAALEDSSSEPEEIE